MLVLLLTIVGCSDFPKIESRLSDDALVADYPRIAPLEGLLIVALGPSQSSGDPVDPAAALAQKSAADTRLANLIARARLMRDAPVNSETTALLAEMN